MTCLIFFSFIQNNKFGQTIEADILQMKRAELGEAGKELGGTRRVNKVQIWAAFLASRQKLLSLSLGLSTGGTRLSFMRWL